MLIDGLPSESLTKTAIRDSMTAADLQEMPEPDGWGQWSHEAALLAAVNDRLGWVIYAIAAQNGGKPDAPEPMRRPGIGRSAADSRELRRKQRVSAAHLAYVMEHDGASPPPGWDAGIDFDD